MMTEEDKAEVRLVSGVLLGLFALFALIMIGMAVQQWEEMDCRLTLEQNGRTPADIKEICK
jgi:hypothetical protein